MRETLTAVKNGSDYIEGSPTLFQWFTCREKNQGKMKKKKNDRIRPEIEKNKKNKGKILSLSFAAEKIISQFSHFCRRFT
jgi:hypothetical protein